jgi:hypothetical protein
VHYYLLEYAIAIWSVLDDMPTALKDIKTLLGDIETTAIGVHTAVTMNDITYGIVLGSD